MFREIRRKSSYTEWAIWSSWEEMLLGIELRPHINKDFWSLTFGITILYRGLFFIEYTRWRDGKDHSQFNTNWMDDTYPEGEVSND